MIYHCHNLFVGQIAIHPNRIPQLLVHMIPWCNLGVLFPQFNGKFGVAFYVKLVAQADAGKQEQLFANLKHKGILAKG